MIDVDSVKDLVALAMEWIMLNGMKTLVAIFIIFVGRYAAKFLQNSITKVLEKSDLDSRYTNLITNTTYYGVFGMVILAALDKVGIDTSAVLAVIGSAGLATGLALQGSLNDIGAGVLIRIFGVYKPGDNVEARSDADSSAASKAKIVEIGIFSTSLVDSSGKTISVSNSTIQKEYMVDHRKTPSAAITAAITIEIGADRNDGVEKIKTFIVETAAKDSNILQDPKPQLYVKSLEGDRLTFSLKLYTQQENYARLKESINENIISAFAAQKLNLLSVRMA